MKRSIQLLAVLLLAPGSPASPQSLFKVTDGHSVEVFDIPRVKVQTASFAVSSTGLVLVPLYGGIFIPSWDGWYLPPQSAPLVAVSFDGADNLYGIVKTANGTNYLVNIDHSSKPFWLDRLAKLSAGMVHLVGAQDRELFVWGLEKQGSWTVLHYDVDSRELKSIWSSERKITAAAVVGEHSMLIAMGKVLVLLSRGSKPTVVATLSESTIGLCPHSRGGCWYRPLMESWRSMKGKMYG